MTLQEKLEELRRRHAAAEAGGGEERRNRQQSEGKLSARERLELLFDAGTLEEIANTSGASANMVTGETAFMTS